jgi:hypothetical protein
LLTATSESFVAFSWFACSEKALEKESGIWLRWNGLGFGAPSEIVLIGTGVTGIAISRFSDRIA